MTDFEKFKEKLPSKEKFYSSLAGKKINDKEYDHVLKVWDKFEMKTMKDYHDVTFYYQLIYLKNLEIIAQKIMVYVQVII